MLEPGELIDGKYRVQRLLGKGGMGAVFEGFHTLVDRRVAIKVLHPDIAASPEGAARFAREVRAAGRIGNEHILEIYDVGSLPDGSRYMVSEYLDGETLSSRLERDGALAPKVAAELTLQLLTGLTAAHQAGIVHRDLKPENIFLLRRKSGKPDFVKIIDFGISKFQLDDGNPMTMTATGAVLGTPYYLSPEQARGLRDIDGRSDLYAVGVILYQMVAGRVPVQAETFNELLFKIALESPPSLAEIMPGLDARFSAITQKAMARERSERFQSATELSDALGAWLGLPPRASAPPPTAAQPVAAAQTPAVEPTARSTRDAATQVSDSGVVTQAAAAVTQGSASGVDERSPTSSNFGRTAQRTTAMRSRGPLVVASVLALSTAAIAAWLLRPAATPTAGPASEVSAEVVKAAPSTVATAATGAADVVASVAAVMPAVPHAASSAASATSAAAVPAVVSRVAPAVRAVKKSGASAAAASKAALRPAAEPARAAPAATSKTKAARDFGY